MAVTFHGWTLREWGIAIKREEFAPETLEQADNLATEWQRNWNNKPGEIQIIGGDYSSALEAAGNVFRMAVKANHPQLKR